MIIKKIFSFFLGSLMLVTGTNVLAGGNDKEDSNSPSSSKRLPVINVAVVGDDDKGKKDFIKSYTRIQGQRYYGVQSYRFKYKGKIIKFFDIPSDLGEDSDDELEKKWINNFLKSSEKNCDVPYCKYVIICLNVETEKEKLVKRAYEWLKEIKERNKDYQMQLVLYNVTEENFSNYCDSKIRHVLDMLTDFEREFMEKHKEVDQFRSSTLFPYGKETTLDNMLKGVNFYDLYMKRNAVKNKNVSSRSSDNKCCSDSLISFIVIICNISFVAGISYIIYCFN